MEDRNLLYPHRQLNPTTLPERQHMSVECAGVMEGLLDGLLDDAFSLARSRVDGFPAGPDGDSYGGVCTTCLRASSEVDDIVHAPGCVVGRVLGAVAYIRRYSPGGR